MILNYGQPINGIMQFSYIVADINKSINQFIELHNVGPWFMAPSFVPPNCLYRGQPSNLVLSLAMAFSGGVMIELVQQHDESPSPYRDSLGTGFGFHHYGIVTDDYDAQTARYARAGYDIIFYTVVQGGRVAYFDTSRELPGMTELIELTPSAEARHTRIHRASLDWDGSDPIRPLSLS